MSFATSRRPVAEKLGLGPDVRLLVLGTELPDLGEPDADAVTHDADVVIVGCASADDVAEYLPTAWRERRNGGRLWLAYRKGMRTFTRADIGAAVEASGLGLTWFRQVSIDDTWSAIWFKHRCEFGQLNH